MAAQLTASCELLAGGRAIAVRLSRLNYSITPWLPLTVQVAEQFVVLYDMEGWRLSHSFHLRKVHAHISTLQARSPAAAHADATPSLPMPTPPRRCPCRCHPAACPVGAGGPARAYCYRQPPLQTFVRVLRAAAHWAQETQARTMQMPKRILLRAP